MEDASQKTVDLLVSSGAAIGNSKVLGGNKLAKNEYLEELNKVGRAMTEKVFDGKQPSPALAT